MVVATGFVDMRKGIDGLATIVKENYKLDPFEKGTLFLFCGRRADRFKFLLWMGNGFIRIIKVEWGFPKFFRVRL